MGFYSSVWAPPIAVNLQPVQFNEWIILQHRCIIRAEHGTSAPDSKIHVWPSSEINNCPSVFGDAFYTFLLICSREQHNLWSITQWTTCHRSSFPIYYQSHILCSEREMLAGLLTSLLYTHWLWCDLSYLMQAYFCCCTNLLDIMP